MFIELEELEELAEKEKRFYFVAPRERRMLKTIEKITRQPIDPMQLPSAKIINEQRVKNFKQRITNTLDNQELAIFEELILDYQKEHEIDAFKISSALALMAQGTESLLLNEKEINQASFDEKNKNKISVSVHANSFEGKSSNKDAQV